MRTGILPSILLLLAANLAGQTHNGPGVASKKTSDSAAWSEIPQDTIAFSRSIPLLGMPQSPLITAPQQCSSNGTLFLEALTPPDYMSRALVSVTKSGKVTPFMGSAGALGLTQVRKIGFFPRNKNVYYLVEARETKLGASKVSPVEDFILRYSASGALESMVRLKISIFPDKFAALPSGRFVVTGIDPVNDSPMLEMLNRHGEPLFPLDLAGSGLYSATKLRQFYKGGHGPDAKNMSSITSAVQFVSYGEDVLLLQTGTNDPVLQIGKDGIIRTISLKLPSGTMVESLLPSSGTGTIYARIVETTAASAVHRMVVFDADTGAPLRVIATSHMPLESIACESDGTFFAFKREYTKENDKGNWTLITALQ